MPSMENAIHGLLLGGICGHGGRHAVDSGVLVTVLFFGQSENLPPLHLRLCRPLELRMHSDRQVKL